MRDRPQNLRSKTSHKIFVYLLFCILFVGFLTLALANSYSQEEIKEDEDDEDKIMDLPTVNIEILDTTQLKIPKEKFHSFTKPDSRIYTPLKRKERPWYLPPTSLPGKLSDTKEESERDFLVSIKAYSGVPVVLSYQMLFFRGFGNAEALVEAGRTSLRKERTPEMVSNENNNLEEFNIDKLRGAITYQTENTNLKVDVNYKAKDMAYLSNTGANYENDRSIANAYLDLDQKLSDNFDASINLDITNLQMTEPVTSDSHGALDIKAGLGFSALLSKSNPIEMGGDISYLDGENENEEAQEATVKLYVRDQYIRFLIFVLSAELNLLFDARKGSENGEGWEPDIYLNPNLIFTSRLGRNAILKFGVERNVIRQNLRDLYIQNNYMRLNPSLSLERSWDIKASLQYRITRKFAITAEAFDREVDDLVIFENIQDDTLSWKPISLESSRIYGFKAGWEGSAFGDRLKHNVEYIQEFHQQENDINIPYRPNNKGLLGFTYEAPLGLEFSVDGEFWGIRYTELNGEETLPGYFLVKPGISKSFGKYAKVFASSQFYFGEDKYQIWKEYGLPDWMIDLGLVLKF
ncbi:hypothetical protein GF312_06960 [Candidatus Poribacteria bacterium]|nr:hypothetical protein [Candidatus Poribacteria bacterium]